MAYLKLLSLHLPRRTDGKLAKNLHWESRPPSLKDKAIPLTGREGP
jgi:hypothetical protein